MLLLEKQIKPIRIYRIKILKININIILHFKSSNLGQLISRLLIQLQHVKHYVKVYWTNFFPKYESNDTYKSHVECKLVLRW